MTDPDVETATDSGASSMISRDFIRHDILERLYNGHYRPGQRLTEAQLTQDYGVSRGTAREALSLLASNGVVVLTPQRGAQIRTLSVAEAINITLVAQSLVGLASRMAAAQINKPGAAEMLQRALTDVVAASKGDHVGYSEARGRFYAAVIEISGNDELHRVLSMVQFQLIPIQYPIARNIVEKQSLGDLRRVAEAILAGRPAAAEGAAQRQVGRALDALQMLLPQA